jgi:hypothetical protein
MVNIMANTCHSQTTFRTSNAQVFQDLQDAIKANRLLEFLCPIADSESIRKPLIWGTDFISSLEIVYTKSKDETFEICVRAESAWLAPIKAFQTALTRFDDLQISCVFAEYLSQFAGELKDGVESVFSYSYGWSEFISNYGCDIDPNDENDLFEEFVYLQKYSAELTDFILDSPRTI